MGNKPGRNEPCSCGSGKKYKNCCMHKQAGSTKTYTPDGKRKFKAKVIDAAASSQTLFNRSAGVAQQEGNPEVFNNLRFRMSGHDYRDEQDTQIETEQSEKPAPKENINLQHNPGDSFEISKDNFQVEENPPD